MTSLSLKACQLSGNLSISLKVSDLSLRSTQTHSQSLNQSQIKIVRFHYNK